MKHQSPRDWRINVGLRWLVVVLMLVTCAACDSGVGPSGPGPQLPRTPILLRDASTTSVDAPVAPIPPEPPRFFVPPHGLDGFFANLRDVERGVEHARAVVLFWGDSHTAGDALTGWLRSQLTARFGDAGRGYVAMGSPPMKHYYQRDVKYGREGVWQVFIGGHKGDGEPLGLGGIRVAARKGAARMWVETCSDCSTGNAVGRFVVHLWDHRDGAKLRYRLDDGAWRSYDTAARRGEPDHATQLIIAAPREGAHRLTIERVARGRGALVMLGVVFERALPGVSVDSVGLVGRRLSELHARNWSIVGPQLAQRSPGLVILQYGTNEADDPRTDLAVLARRYDVVIANIRATVPQASIILLGPPDMAARAAGKRCDDRRRFPLDATTGLPLIECQWHTPRMLGQVIDVQRAAAVRNQVAFFDTQQAMGGAEQMPSFCAAEPKLAFADHVHFTKLGYQRWGELLLNELLASYAVAFASTTPVVPAPTLPSVPTDAASAPSPGSSPP